jgi:hypothetical protein
MTSSNIQSVVRKIVLGEVSYISRKYLSAAIEEAERQGHFLVWDSLDDSKHIRIWIDNERKL